MSYFICPKCKNVVPDGHPRCFVCNPYTLPNPPLYIPNYPPVHPPPYGYDTHPECTVLPPPSFCEHIETDQFGKTRCNRNVMVYYPVPCPYTTPTPPPPTPTPPPYVPPYNPCTCPPIPPCTCPVHCNSSCSCPAPVLCEYCHSLIHPPTPTQ